MLNCESRIIRDINGKRKNGVLLHLSPDGNTHYGVQMSLEHLKEIVDAAKNGEFDEWLEEDWNSTTEVNTE